MFVGGVFSGYMADSKTWEIRSHILISQKIGTERSIWISCLKLLQSCRSKKSTTDPIPLAVAEVLKVTAIVRVTDVYGPIPYSQ
ncbi:hypothetical protein KUBF_29600 [Bacteroides finegoldii]|nr:hypothetical protein KUBF_29600 [Bacteroides finegoldii]